jgi:microcystin-dependent protein
MANLKVAEGVSIDGSGGFLYSPGDIIMLNSISTPTGFLSCDGSTITQAAYPSLFSVLGTYYDAAGLVCKLPDLNAQFSWIFPCGTVGNDISYGGSSSHTHTAANATITSGTYTTAAHTHTVGSNSQNATEAHTHSMSAPGVGINVASTLANRSNGSGQGTNLAIYGHTHSWGSSAGLDTAQHDHGHTMNMNVSSAASNHSHSATLVTNTTSGSYIPDNVISMRYYIKW